MTLYDAPDATRRNAVEQLREQMRELLCSQLYERDVTL